MIQSRSAVARMTQEDSFDRSTSELVSSLPDRNSYFSTNTTDHQLVLMPIPDPIPPIELDPTQPAMQPTTVVAAEGATQASSPHVDDGTIPEPPAQAPDLGVPVDNLRDIRTPDVLHRPPWDAKSGKSSPINRLLMRQVRQGAMERILQDG
jgi:hypothetical protein